MTLLITIGPSIALLLYFILSDKFKEPKKIIIITFVTNSIFIYLRPSILHQIKNCLLPSLPNNENWQDTGLDVAQIETLRFLTSLLIM